VGRRILPAWVVRRRNRFKAINIEGFAGGRSARYLGGIVKLSLAFKRVAEPIVGRTRVFGVIAIRGF